MKPLTERQRNFNRYKTLSKADKELANNMAMEQFKKPILTRIKPSAILDVIQFFKRKKIK